MILNASKNHNVVLSFGKISPKPFKFWFRLIKGIKKKSKTTEIHYPGNSVGSFNKMNANKISQTHVSYINVNNYHPKVSYK